MIDFAPGMRAIIRDEECCEQLCTIYRIYFPVLKQYEDDTWYDAKGRIVFTNNRSLINVGFERKEWESVLKDAPSAKSSIVPLQTTPCQEAR